MGRFTGEGRGSRACLVEKGEDVLGVGAVFVRGETEQPFHLLERLPQQRPPPRQRRLPPASRRAGRQPAAPSTAPAARRGADGGGGGGDGNGSRDGRDYGSRGGRVP